MNEHTIETYKSMIGISAEALKTLQVLNGGAIVALLAYLGQVPAKPCQVARIAFPLALFVVDLLCGTFGFLFSYFTQFALYNESLGRSGLFGSSHQRWLWATVVVALLSLAGFAWGAFASVSVLTVACP
jgi:hypothetical protein